jgi:tetratricopeptide (TPR) repeat protein
MKRKTGVSFLYFLFFIQALCLDVKATALPDSPTADSLKKLLANPLADSVRYKVVGGLVAEYMYSKPSEAFPYAKEMLRIALAEKSMKKAANAYTKLGLIYHSLGDYDKAIEYGYKTIREYEDLHDTADLAGAHLNLANVYKSKRDFVKTLELDGKALDLFSRVHNKAGLAYTYNNMATVYEEQKKYPQALEYFTKSLTLKKERGDLHHMAGTYLNIGLIEMDLKKPDSALYYYNKSLALNKEFNNVYGICDVYIDLGTWATEEKNFKRAKEYLDSAMILAVQLHSTESIIDIHDSYYLMYKKWGNPEMALAHYEKFLEEKDSVLNEKSSRQSADMAARYESEKKDKDNEIKARQSEVLVAQLKKDQAFIIGLAVAVVGVILMALLFYNRFRLRQKMNQQLSFIQTQIQEQKKEITDSIHYARRIQESVMLRPERIKEILGDSFLLYRPKQIVSGDFYWVHENGEEILVVAVDNMLYGVPGAFISLVGINLLNRAVQEENIHDLSELVHYINQGIISTLKQMKSGDQYADRLHFSICRLSTRSKTLECITSANSLYVIRNTELRELSTTEAGTPGIHKLSLQGGEQVYLFTDGYANQLGGADGKKMMVRKLQETLVGNSGQPMQAQLQQLEEVLESWKKNFEQVDDILLIGFRPD